MTALQTFCIPAYVRGTKEEVALGEALIAAWRVDGIFQIATTESQSAATEEALRQSHRFFARPLAEKARHVSDLSYSGYVASGEEMTAGDRDAAEIFTVCPDVALGDPRCMAGWPCHGPVPWPDFEYQLGMQQFMGAMGDVGQRLLQLLALGLGLSDLNGLSRLTEGGFHHMRVLRFPEARADGRKGIGAHTDYGFLVLAAQDDVGGLYIRPPVAGERRNRNWLPSESTAGMYEQDGPWTYVAPTRRVWTAFPGDMLQYLTGGLLLSTPHKVKMAARERFALAYFHEPRFETRLEPLWTDGQAPGVPHIDYGMHFTRMFMRCYPERAVSRRILEEDRLTRFAQTLGGVPCESRAS